MLWEVAMLNKMHKTKDFRKIKSRAVIGKVLYIITSDNTSSSVLESIKEDEVKLSQNEHELFVKYGLEDLSSNKKDVPFYSKLLYFYDWVLITTDDLVAPKDDIKEKMIYWTGFMFRTWHGKGPSSTTFEDAKDGLQKFNKYLSLRSAIIGHSLSSIDVIAVSAIRQSESIWPHLTDTKFKGYENIKRWFDWIEGLNQISWDMIHNRDENKTSVKKAKETQLLLTGSHELIEAVKRKNLKKAKAILHANPLSVASCDMKQSKMSLAHIAWENQDLDMLKLLVEFKIDLEATDADGMTCLYYSIEQKSIEITKYLIDQGVNLDHRDLQNRSSIYWAASWGEIPNLKLLLDAGCDPNIKSRLGRTALSKACWNGFVDVVECLLSTGKIDINSSDNHGRTALHNAVWGSAGGRLGEKWGVSDRDSPECAQLLLEYGADPNFKDDTGNTPLNIACSTFGVDCLRLLISFGADINMKNNYGTTPFLSACFRGNYECWKILYEYKELDPFVKTQHGYGPLELSIEAGKGRIVKWVIEEKLNNNKDYSGLEIDLYDPILLMHHAVNNPNTSSETVSILLDYLWNKNSQAVIECFLDVLNRSILRKSTIGVQVLFDFYVTKDLSNYLQFNEVLLEASIHMADERLFEYILSNYHGELPQIALQTIVFLQNEIFLKMLLSAFKEQFKSPDWYHDIFTIPEEFTKVIDKDFLSDYTYFEKLKHPIFNDPEKFKIFMQYDPLQLAVYLDNSRLVKPLLDSTCYKASTLLKNGDNIIHLMVSQKFGDSFILQKLLERLEIEVGGKENLKKEFLMTKSETDGLTALEYCAGSKIHAPILYKYSSVTGIPEDDWYSQSSVLDVDIIHKLSLAEEEKLDKKAVALDIKNEARIKYKELIKQTEALWKGKSFELNYSKEIGLDLSGKM